MEAWDQIENLRNYLLTLSGNNHIFSLQTLSFIFKEIDSHHQNMNDRHWIVNFVRDYLYCCQIAQNSQKLGQPRKDLAQKINLLGTQFQRNNNEIHFKHRQSVKILQKLFSSTEKNSINLNKLTYNLRDKNEILKVSKFVKTCCQEDLNSFFFLSAYLTECCKRLAKEECSVISIEKQLLDTLNFLGKEHPPNDKKPKGDTTIDVESSKKVQHTLSINLSKINPENRNQKLDEYILNVAQIAKENLNNLIQLTKQICYQNNGIGYKVGVKIKDKNSLSSIDRVKQKLLSKKLQKNQISKSEMNLAQFVKKERDQYHQILAKFFASSTQDIKFSVSDMLRGKCMFEEIKQIKKAAQQIISKIKEKGYAFQIDNKLNEKTTDLVFKIKINEIIAEFQLAYKFNIVKNEFNHKIYELTRAKFYSIINTLFIFNQKNGQFFQQIFCRTRKLQKENKEVRIKMYEKQELEPINKLRQSYEIFLKENKCILQEQLFDEISEKQLSQIREQIDKINQQKRQKSYYKNCYKMFYNGVFLKRCYKLNEALEYLMKEKLSLQEYNAYFKGKTEFSYDLDKQIAKTLQMANRLDDALKWYENILQNQDETSKCYTLKNIGSVYYRKGKNQQALQCFQKALEVQQRVHGKNSLQCAGILNNIGSVYKNLGNFQQALKYYEKCLEIKQNLTGYGSIQCAGALNNIGLIYFYTKKYAQALHYYEKCHQINQKFKGQNSMDCTGILQNIGIVYSEKRSYDKALRCYQKSLEIKQQAKGEDNIDCADTLNNIGYVYKALQKYQLAMNYFEKCLFIQKNTKGEDCIDCATTLSNIGSIYMKQQKYPIALNYYEKCHHIQQKAKGIECLDCSFTQDKIGFNLQKLGNFDEALKHYQNALSIKQKVRGQNSSHCIVSLQYIGSLYVQQGKIDQGLKYYKKSIQIHKLKPINLGYANTLCIMGNLLKKQSRLQQSLSLFSKSFEIKKCILGPQKQQVLSLQSIVNQLKQSTRSKIKK